MQPSELQVDEGTLRRFAERVNPRVLEAMRTVPRHLFVEPTQRAHAYDDGPVPIGGSKQTIFSARGTNLSMSESGQARLSQPCAHLKKFGTNIQH